MRKAPRPERRLLEAAIRCVIECGYANTTGSEIAEPAGLSRGAQLCHFPTKEDLFAKAVEYVCELMFNEMRRKVEQLPVEADRRSIAMDLIWETLNGLLYRGVARTGDCQPHRRLPARFNSLRQYSSRGIRGEDFERSVRAFHFEAFRTRVSFRSCSS
jgi:AcrR family transcriptional regulator